MSDDAQYLDALDEVFSEIEELKHDVNVWLEHRVATPKVALLQTLGRLDSTVKTISAGLGPEWKR